MTQRKPITEDVIVYLVDPEETLSIVIDMRDRRAFERDGWNDLNVKPITVSDGNGGFLTKWPEALEIMKGKPEEYRTWVAWAAAKRQGKFTSTIVNFRARCVGIFTDEEETPEIDSLGDPTQTDQPVA